MQKKIITLIGVISLFGGCLWIARTRNYAPITMIFLSVWVVCLYIPIIVDRLLEYPLNIPPRILALLLVVWFGMTYNPVNSGILTGQIVGLILVHTLSMKRCLMS